MFYFITGNDHKFHEASAVITDLEQLNIDLPEVQEIDPRIIIKAKLEEALKHHQGQFVVEDTSLHLECLGGLPGPLIKWFVKAIGTRGIYELAKKYNNYQAKARTMIGYSDGQSEIVYFEGIVSGKLVEPKVASPFGWDPIFQPDGYEMTFAEMGSEAKNKISMRRQAFEKLKEFLNK